MGAGRIASRRSVRRAQFLIDLALEGALLPHDEASVAFRADLGIDTRRLGTFPLADRDGISSVGLSLRSGRQELCHFPEVLDGGYDESGRRSPSRHAMEPDVVMGYLPNWLPKKLSPLDLKSYVYIVFEMETRERSMRCTRYSSAVVIGLVASSLVANVKAAEGPLVTYQGAWLADDLACGDVFTPGRKGMMFKVPTELFVPAFIISGDRISTPWTACRIGAVSRIGDRDNLSLFCVHSVTRTQSSAILAKGSDGRLKRYSNASDQTGSNYRLCSK
jgi:hypothetical protein